MVLVYAILLGVIQGLTEFLPVSSSAHLILARAFFGWNGEPFGMTFDVACHVGTLLAVVVYFWPDLLSMIRAVPRMGSVFGPRRDPSAWMALLIVIGTVPAVVAGLLLKDVEARLRTPIVAAMTLALVALVFFAVERFGAKRRRQESLTWRDVILIGCAQAAALVPGVSRSGATISAGMALGLRRDEAARFGFLLGVPAILGAAALEVWKNRSLLRHGLPPGEGTIFVVGIVSSAVVGYLAVRLFIRYLTRHSLSVFAWYRLALASSVVIWWVAR
jgi:undecaprenyl-diphosphatase